MLPTSATLFGVLTLMSIVSLSHSYHLRYRRANYNNCMENPDVYFYDVDISPDPVSLPGLVQGSGQVVIVNRLPNRVRADVILTKKLWMFDMRIPCQPLNDFISVGSCTYNDICPILRLFDYSCHADPGTHAIDTGNMFIPFPMGRPEEDSPLVEMLASGQYNVRLKLYNDETNRMVGCMSFRLFVEM